MTISVLVVLKVAAELRGETGVLGLGLVVVSVVAEEGVVAVGGVELPGKLGSDSLKNSKNEKCFNSVKNFFTKSYQSLKRLGINNQNYFLCLYLRC